MAASPRPINSAATGVSPTARRKCGASSLKTVGASISRPASSRLAKTGRFQRHAASPAPIMNGTLISGSKAGMPGTLLRGSRSPCTLNIPSDASKFCVGLPGAAPLGPTAI